MSGQPGLSGGARRGAGRPPHIPNKNRQTGRLYIRGQWVKVRVKISRTLSNQVQYMDADNGGCIAIFRPDPTSIKRKPRQLKAPSR